MKLAKPKRYTVKESALPLIDKLMGDERICPIATSLCLNEKNGTWLQDIMDGYTNDVIWFALQKDADVKDQKYWLEIAINPANKPALSVNVICFTEKEMAKHINTRCRGWQVRSCNIKGVKYVVRDTDAWPTVNDIMGKE